MSTGIPRVGPPLGSMLALLLAVMLTGVNSSMIAVALVDINRDLDTGASIVWLITAFYLMSAVAVPIAGRLADQAGPRRVLVVGMVLTLAASGSVQLSDSFSWLIVTRVLVAAGTAVAFPAAVVVFRRWPEAPNAHGAHAQGFVALTLVSQAAVALGPAVGGVLVARWGWQATFFANIPIAAASIVLAVAFLPADGSNERRGASRHLATLDPAGCGLFVLALGGLMIALTERLTPFTLAVGAAALSAAALFVIWELRTEQPFIDVRMLRRNMPLTATYVRQALTMVVLYGVLFGLPSWMQDSRGLSVDIVGLLMIPVAGTGIITTIVAGRIIKRSGVHAALVIGAAVMMIGSAALLFVDDTSPVLVLLLVGALLGAPNGFVSLGNQLAMFVASPPASSGVSSGLLRTSQSVGAHLASAVLALTLGAGYDDAGLHRLAFVLLAVGALLLLESAWWLRRGRQ